MKRMMIKKNGAMTEKVRGKGKIIMWAAIDGGFKFLVLL